MLGGWEKKWIQTLQYSVSVTAGHYLTICQLFPISNYQGIDTQAQRIVKTNPHTHIEVAAAGYSLLCGRKQNSMLAVALIQFLNFNSPQPLLLSSQVCFSVTAWSWIQRQRYRTWFPGPLRCNQEFCGSWLIKHSPVNIAEGALLWFRISTRSFMNNTSNSSPNLFTSWSFQLCYQASNVNDFYAFMATLPDLLFHSVVSMMVSWCGKPKETRPQ